MASAPTKKSAGPAITTILSAHPPRIRHTEAMIAWTRSIIAALFVMAFAGAAAPPFDLSAHATSTAAAETPSAPALTLTPAIGAELRALAHLAGTPAPRLEGRIVVVTFFASWCPPCVEEFRHLKAVHSAYPPDKFSILAINSAGGLGRAVECRTPWPFSRPCGAALHRVARNRGGFPPVRRRRPNSDAVRVRPQGQAGLSLHPSGERQENQRHR